MAVTLPMFTKLTFAGHLFAKNSYTELHENPANGFLAADARQLTGGQAWSLNKVFFCYFTNNAKRHC